MLTFQQATEFCKLRRTFEGEVTRIVHEADIAKNTLEVKVAIRDPVADLKPEMLARVQFLSMQGEGTQKVKERVFAPERLLRKEGGGRAKVWIVDKGRGEALLKQVTLGGGREGDWLEISAGLNPGDVLIDGDTAGLEEGTGVNIVGETR